MTEDGLETEGQYEAAYRGARDAVLSVVSGAVVVLVGVFGVGLLGMTARVLVEGTATPTTFLAGGFGAAATAFAAYELSHR